MANRAMMAAAVGLTAAGAWGQCEQGWDGRFGASELSYPLHSVVQAEVDGRPVLFAAGYWTGDYWSWEPDGGLLSWDGSGWADGAAGLDAGYAGTARFCPDETGGVIAYGGEFSLGRQTLGALARWDGAAWASLKPPFDVRLIAPGGGPDAEGTAVVSESDGQIAVRTKGEWRSIADDLGRFDVRSIVRADLGNGTRLYAFGRFTHIGGQAIASAVAWDGTNWNPIGWGLPSQTIDGAWAFDLDGRPGILIPARGESFVFYDGSSWTPIPAPGWPENSWYLGVCDLEGSPVMVLSQWWYGDSSRWLWVWDGVAWRRLPGVFDGLVSEVRTVQVGGREQLVAVGEFRSIDGIPHPGAAAFDGRRWSAIGAASPVGAIRNGMTLLPVGDEGGPALGNRLYVGGPLRSGWLDAGCVASWDGVRWESLGLWNTGGAGTVTAMTIADLGEGPRLIVGGDIWEDHGRMWYVGQWDGHDWSNLGPQFQIQGEIQDFATFDDGSGPALYATGRLSYNYHWNEYVTLVRYRGGEWQAFGQPLDGEPTGMVVLDEGNGPALYLSGHSGFVVGEDRIGPVVRWTPGGWEQAGQPLYDMGAIGTAESLSLLEIGGTPRLVVTGYFDGANGYERVMVLVDGAWTPGTEFLPGDPDMVRSTATPHGLVTISGETIDGGEMILSVTADGQSREIPGTVGPWVWDLAISEVGGTQAVFAAGTFTVADGVDADGFARYGCPACPADFDGDADADELDVVAFLGLWGAGNAAGDFNADGWIDTRDVIAFLNAWNAGCP